MDVLYREALIEADDLEFIEIEDRWGLLERVGLRGHIRCRKGVRIRVLKWMDVRQDSPAHPEVLTVFYQYHAWRPASDRKGQRTLLRYDQAHGEPHRHSYDALGREAGLTRLTLDAMPRLDEVIREVVALAEVFAQGR